MVLGDDARPVKAFEMQKKKGLKLLVWTLSGLLSLLVFAGVGLVFMVKTAQLSHQSKKMKAENQELQQSLDSLGGRVTRLDTNLKTARHDLAQMAKLAGAEDLVADPSNPKVTGVGGGQTPKITVLSQDPKVKAMAEDVALLLGTSEWLKSASSEVGQLLDAKVALLRHTPSIWPVPGFLASRFGWRKDPVYGGGEFHKGLDLAAPYRTKIKAPADGVVVFVGRKGGYGNAVELSHGNGLNTRYGHMYRPLVKAGQKVKRGDVIGLVGSTGKATGPHLHYEVWRNGKAVNPLPYLRR